MAGLANLLGEDASCGPDDHVRRPDYRNIAGFALGDALLGPVTAIHPDQPQRRSWPRRAPGSRS